MYTTVMTNTDNVWNWFEIQTELQGKNYILYTFWRNTKQPILSDSFVYIPKHFHLCVTYLYFLIVYSDGSG